MPHWAAELSMWVASMKDFAADSCLVDCIIKVWRNKTYWKFNNLNILIEQTVWFEFAFHVFRAFSWFGLLFLCAFLVLNFLFYFDFSSFILFGFVLLYFLCLSPWLFALASHLSLGLFKLCFLFSCLLVCAVQFCPVLFIPLVAVLLPTKPWHKTLCSVWKNHTQLQQPAPPVHVGHQPGHTLMWDDIPSFNQHLLQVN